MERKNAVRRGLAAARGLVVLVAALTASRVASADCPPGYPHDCGDGTCSSDEGCDPSSEPQGTCPNSHPYSCGDGTCCPEAYPYCCGDGTCGASYGACEDSQSSCPPEYPYRCEDGYCWDSPCGTGTIWPEEGSCAMGVAAPSSSGSSGPGGALSIMALALVGGLVRARRAASKEAR